MKELIENMVKSIRIEDLRSLDQVALYCLIQNISA